MNNYNFIERKLHDLVLGNKFINKSLFELEKQLFKFKNFTSEYHIFITGLPRSGTTILLNYIYQTNCFSSFKYSDMPFILSPNLFNFFKFKKKNKNFERFHSDNIKINYDSPESFDEVFFSNFDTANYDEELKYFISSICIKCKKERYLSKNNNNYKRIEIIKKNLKNSLFLIPYRLPLDHCYSLLNQHRNFLKLDDNDYFVKRYLRYLGHNEFGENHLEWFKPIKFINKLEINYWLEQWHLFYENLINKFSNQNFIFFINYEHLCSDSHYVNRLNKIIGVSNESKNFFKKVKGKQFNLNYDEALLKECENTYKKLAAITF